MRAHTLETPVKRSVPQWLTVSICLFYGFIGVSAIGWMTLRVDNYAEPIAVVFPPNINAELSFMKVVNANGSPIRYGASGNIIIAQFDVQSAKEIKQKTNALFLMNPIAAGACFLNEGEYNHVL